MEFWFSEMHTPRVKLSVQVDRQLYSEENEYIRLDIFESPEFGRFLTVDGYIITTERDKKMSAQAIVNFFYLLYKGLNIDGCSSHSGRRTFITQATKMISQAGGTINDVRQLAEHSSLATTQRYIEYNTEAHKKIIEMI